MRLGRDEAIIIRDTAREVFGENVEVRLFGSRLDDSRRGGDIDLYVETDLELSEALLQNLRFKSRLDERLGERKIDTVIRSRRRAATAFQEIARYTGVIL